VIPATEVISYQVTNLIKKLHTFYNLPVIITEYGAESLPGLHVVGIVFNTLFTYIHLNS